jgi:hypothetical protein
MQVAELHVAEIRMSVYNMDISVVISMLASFINKTPIALQNNSLSACEKRLENNFSKNMFIISSECFDQINKSSTVTI